MTPRVLYEMIRIIKISKSEDDYDGFGINTRKPQIGDVGTIVEIIKTNNNGNVYIVESTSVDGKPIFLSLFNEDEIDSMKSEIIA